MTPLGQAIYFGELCGALTLLTKRGTYSEEGAQALLMEQGLTRKITQEMWQAANRAVQE